MKTRWNLAASCAAIVASAFLAKAFAGGNPEPVTSVNLAKTWESAIEEAKSLNVPVVVHSHGFYCGPCWGMHSAVMCNKKYIEFAGENTVEVISLDRLDEGIEKKDKRAETYEAKVNGEKVQYMVEFPGLTSEQMLALHKSKASSFNDTGKIPYTCLVDPWTETQITHWSGGQSAQTIIEAITEARKTLTKDHGKGVARKDIRVLTDAEEDAAAKVAKGDFAGGLDLLAKVNTKAEKWPDSLKERLTASRAKIVEQAEKALAGKLKGTGLEAKAKEMLASL